MEEVANAKFNWIVFEIFQTTDISNSENFTRPTIKSIL